MSRKTTELIAGTAVWATGILVILVLVFIVTFILWEGVPVLNWQFLFNAPQNMGRSGGIFPTIVGTAMVTAVAIILSTPLGLGAAIYLTEYTRETRLTRVLRFGAECLAGVPSIVYGLFGFIFFVIYLGLGWSILSGGLTLAVMILPTIIRTSEEALRSVPYIYREVSFSLGGSRLQNTVKAVLPSALPGITTGVILSIGRSVAETAAVILTAGSSLRIPTSLFSPTRTMAVHFYILAREGISLEMAYGTAALLIIIILLINILANFLVRRFAARVC